MKIAFNYSGDNNTVTLTDIEKTTTPEVFGCDGSDVGKQSASEHFGSSYQRFKAVSITLLPTTAVFVITYSRVGY